MRTHKPFYYLIIAFIPFGIFFRSFCWCCNLLLYHHPYSHTCIHSFIHSFRMKIQMIDTYIVPVRVLRSFWAFFYILFTFLVYTQIIALLYFTAEIVLKNLFGVRDKHNPNNPYTYMVDTLLTWLPTKIYDAQS